MPTSVKVSSQSSQLGMKASQAVSLGGTAHLISAMETELTNCVKNLRALSRVSAQQTSQTQAQKRISIAELQSLWPKFEAQGVPRLVMLQRFVEHGEKITTLQGMHTVAQTFCFEKVLAQLTAHVDESVTADGKGTAAELSILRIRAELGILVCQQLELHYRNPLFRMPTTPTKNVQLLRRFTTIIHECLKSDATSSLALNGIAYAKITVRQLLEQGFLLQLLDFVMWMVAGMESCVSLIGAAYLGEWVDVYKLAYDCYTQMGEFASARAFLVRCQAKITEVESLETKSAGSGGVDATTTKLIAQAKESLAMVVASSEIFGIANLSNDVAAFSVDRAPGPITSRANGPTHALQPTLTASERSGMAAPKEPLQRAISRRLSAINIEPKPVALEEDPLVEDPGVQEDLSIEEGKTVPEVVGPPDATNEKPTNLAKQSSPKENVATKENSAAEEQAAATASVIGKGQSKQVLKPKKPKKRKNMAIQMQISYEDASDAIKRRQIIVSCGALLASNFNSDQQRLSAILTCLKSLAGNELNMFFQERPSKDSMDKDKLAYHLLDIAFALLCAPQELATLTEMAQTQTKTYLADDIRVLRIRPSEDAKQDILRSARTAHFPTGDLADFARQLFRFGQWERFYFTVDFLRARTEVRNDSVMGEMRLRSATVSLLKSLSGKRKVVFEESKAESTHAIVNPETESTTNALLNRLIEAIRAFMPTAQGNSRKYGALLTDVINVMWCYCEPLLESERVSRQALSGNETIINAFECLFSLTKILPNVSSLLHAKIATSLSSLYESSKLHTQQVEVLYSAINRLREERQYALADEGGTLASITCDPTLYQIRIENDGLEDEKWTKVREFAFLETDLWANLLRTQLRLLGGEGGNASRQNIAQKKKHHFKGHVDEADEANAVNFGSHTELNALKLMITANYSDSLSRGDRGRLLEESAALLELAAKKEGKLLKTAFKKLCHFNPSGEFRCPPPILVRRSLTSVTVRPAPLHDPKDNKVVLPFWYEVFCSRKTPPRVTLNDVEFGGTGQMIRYSENMEITVSGLTPYQTYYFALAAFDESRNMIGTGIGHISNGIVTALPLPLLLLWGYQGKVAERFRFEEHTRKAKTVLWNHFVRSVVTDEQLANPYQCKHLQSDSFCWCRYYETRMDYTYPTVLKLFAQNIAAAVTWDEEEVVVYTDMAGTRAVKVAQLARLQCCRSLMVALDIAMRVADGPLALNVVCKCYELLAQLMRLDVNSPFVVKAATKCHEAFVRFHQTATAKYDAVLREVFYPLSIFLVVNGGRVKEITFVDKIVAGTLEILSHRLTTSPKILNSAQLEAMWFKGVMAPKRIRYQSIKNAEFTEFQQHTQMPTSEKVGALYVDMPPPHDNRFVDAVQSLQLRATHFRGDKLALESTTTLRDVFQLTNTSREAVYQEISQKFKRHPRYIELVSAVVEEAYHHGEFELLIKICNDTYEFWNARREAILRIDDTTPRDTRRETIRRKKRNMFIDKRAMYSITSKKVLAANASVRKSRAGSVLTVRTRETFAQLDMQATETLNEMELSAIQAKRMQDASRVLRELLVDQWKASRWRRHLRKLLKMEAPWKVSIVLTHAKAMRQQVQRKAQRILPKTVSRTPSTLISAITGGPSEAPSGINTMPVVTESDEEEQAGSGVVDLLRSASLLDMMQFHSQATMLAARARLWLQMLQSCRELWNTTTFMVQHQVFTEEFSRNYLWRACFMSAQCIVDFLLEVKLERVLTTSATTVERKHIVFAEAHNYPATHTPSRLLQNSQIFASWTDEDGSPQSCQVDLGWCSQFISYTVYHLLQAERYHRVVSIGERFNKVTGHAYAELTSGLIDRACAALKERGEEVVVAAPAVRGKKLHAYLQLRHECRDLIARCGRDTGAGSQATALQVVSAHQAALREANAADDAATASMVCSELGDFLFDQGDSDAAALYWSKCVDSLFGVDRVVERWKHLLQKQLPPATLVSRLGARYCYVAAVSLAKMARYAYYGNLDKHLELCMFAAQLCTTPLHVSLPHPLEPQQYMSYIPQQLIPGFEFLNDSRTIKMGQLVECFDYVSSVLIDHSCYREVLPLLSLIEYISTQMMNNLPFLIAIKLKRVQAMIAVGMMPLAISSLTEICTGYAIPAEKRIALGIRATPAKLTYNSSQGLSGAHNARVLKQLVDQTISENVGTCYSRAIIDRIELCRARLLFELAKTEQDTDGLAHVGESKLANGSNSGQLSTKPSSTIAVNRTKSTDSLVKGITLDKEGDASPAGSMASVAGNLTPTSRRASMSVLTKKIAIESATLLDRAETIASLIITDVVNEHNRNPGRKFLVDRLVMLVLAYRIVADIFSHRGALNVSIKVMFGVFAALNTPAFEDVRDLLSQTDLSRATLLKWRMDCIDWMLRQGYFILAARNSQLVANEARLANCSTSYVAASALAVVANNFLPLSMRRITESDVIQLESQVAHMRIQTYEMVVVAQLIAGLAKSAFARLTLLNHAHAAAERLSKMFSIEERIMHTNVQMLLSVTKYLLACELQPNTDGVTVLRYLEQARDILESVRSDAPWLTLAVLVKLGDVVTDIQQESSGNDAGDLKKRGIRYYKEALDIAVSSGADQELIMDVIRSIFVTSWEDGNVLFLCNALYSVCQTARMKADLTALMPKFAAEKLVVKDIPPAVLREIQPWGNRRDGVFNAELLQLDPAAILTMQPIRLLNPSQPVDPNREISTADVVSLYVGTRADLSHWRQIPIDPYAIALQHRKRMLDHFLTSTSPTFSECRHKDPPDFRSAGLLPGGPAAGVAWFNRLPRTWADVPLNAIGCAVFAKLGREPRPEKQRDPSEKSCAKEPQQRKVSSLSTTGPIVILFAMMQPVVVARIQKQVQDVRQKLTKCKLSPGKGRPSSASCEDVGTSYRLILSTIEKELVACPQKTCASGDCATWRTIEHEISSKPTPPLTQKTLDHLLAMFDPRIGYLSTTEDTELVPWLTTIVLNAHCT